MPDFIIAGEKVIIRKSPNHIQNTLLIGDSTILLGIILLNDTCQKLHRCWYLQTGTYSPRGTGTCGLNPEMTVSPVTED